MLLEGWLAVNSGAADDMPASMCSLDSREVQGYLARAAHMMIRCRKCRDAGRRTASFLEAVEHVDKEVVHDVQHLVVVLVDGHLEVQPCELAQMAVREGLLRPAERTASVHLRRLEYALESMLCMPS